MLAHQIREAFPWDEAPRYLIRDRDAIFGKDFVATTKGMGVEEVVIAPRSPWQNPYVERLIGSIRRECLDHIIVWNERSLRRRWSVRATVPRLSFNLAAISRRLRPSALKSNTLSWLKIFLGRCAGKSF